MSTEKGLIVVFSAPSGCGKTTVVERLLKRHPDWVRSISATTRDPRPDEKGGVDYFFLSEEVFIEKQERSEFIEYARVHDYYYGTPRSFVLDQYEQGNVVILAIDVQGMKQITENLKHDGLLTLFMLPPSMKVLRERLEGRKTEEADVIDRRLKVAEEEIKYAGDFDFSVINQNLEDTVFEIEQIILNRKKEGETT